MKLCIAVSNDNDLDKILDSSFLENTSGLVYGKRIENTHQMLRILPGDLTDILIVDSALPGGDVFACLEEILLIRHIQVIMIVPSATYEYAYRAMKIGVCELLPRPFTSGQVSAAIHLAVEKRKASLVGTSAVQNDSRSTFADYLDSIIDGRRNVQDLNSIFNIHFQEGMFQVITIALDSDNQDRIQEYRELIWHSMRTSIDRKLLAYTFDVLHAYIYNEIRIVLNYPPENEIVVRQMMSSVFLEAEEITHTVSGLHLFMGIGRAYDDINGLPVSAEESKNGIWARMSNPAGRSRVAEFHGSDLMDDSVRKRMNDMADQIQHAMETLNQQQFISSVSAFFNLPEQILGTPDARVLLLNTIRYFFNVHKKSLSDYQNIPARYYNIKMSVLSSQDFSQFKSRYLQGFLPLFRQISDIAENAQHRCIDMARSYISDHFSSDLTLESIAALFDMNPSYFSRLFHRETGRRFSDYVLDLRMRSACSLLKNSSYRINEIAESVGYTDQRYFAKVFQKETGMTPTQYRKTLA